MSVRAFFGLPLPEAHRAALDAYIAECATHGTDFRWTPAANLHLTIQFLGQVDSDVVTGVADRLASDRLQAFDLQLGELGAFKRGRVARVIWLGLAAGAGDVAALAERVKSACVSAGLEVESRVFHAHLTLARARPRAGAPLPVLPPPPPTPPWRAGELVLYRSRLGRPSSVYEPLRVVSLS